MEAFDEVFRFVARVRRRRTVNLLLLAALWTLALWGLTACFGALAVLLFGPTAMVRVTTLAAAGVAFLTVAFLTVPLVTRARDPLGAARAIEARVPGLADGTLTLLQFRPRLAALLAGPAEVSGTLLRLLAERTAAGLRRSRPALVAPLTPVWHLAVVTVGLGVGFAGAAELNPELVREGLTGLLRGPEVTRLAEEIALRRVVDVVVGDIEVTYRYPDYAHLPARTERNGTGDLRALVGTAVTLKTRAHVPVRRAFIVLGSAPDAPVALAALPDGTLEGTLRITRPDTYRLRVERLDGSQLEDHANRLIEPTPDHPPEVRLLAPSGDLERRADDELLFAVQATDDLGLTRLELVTQVDRPDAVPLRKTLAEPAGPRVVQAEARLGLGELALRPGERLTAWVEATDTNTAAGPGVGFSERREIRIFSAREKHETLLAAERGLIEAMLVLLADRLEHGAERAGMPPAAAAEPEPLAAAAARVQTSRRLVEQFEALIHDMKADLLTPAEVLRNFAETASRLRTLYDLEAGLVIQARAAADRKAPLGPHLAALASANAEAVPALERAVLLSDRMVERQVQERVLNDGDLVLRHQQETLAALRKAEQAGDDESRRRLQRELERLLRSVEALRQGLTSQAKALPDDRFNQNALGTRATTEKLLDMSREVAAVRDLVRDGRLAAARERLEALTKATENAMLGLQDEYTRGKSSDEGRLRRIVARWSHQAERLAIEQGGLRNETARLEQTYARELRRRLPERQGKLDRRLTEALDRVAHRLGALERAPLHPSDQKALAAAETLLGDLRLILGSGDLGQGARLSTRLDDELTELTAEVEQGAAVASDDGQRRALERNGRRLASARDNVAALARELTRRLPDPAEILDRKTQRELLRLADRQTRLGERLGRLRERLTELGDEHIGLQEQVGKTLDESGASMRRAAERLRQLDANIAAEHEDAALERLADARAHLDRAARPADAEPPAHRLGQEPPDDGPGLPQPEDFRVPAAFREELLEAMREPAPPAYEKVIEAYYEALVR